MKIFLAALVATLPFSSLWGAAISWTGGGDGTSWGDAANWSPNAPAAGDDVTIDVPSDPTVVISSDLSIGSLNCQENLTLASGGKLTLTAGASVLSGTLTQANFTRITTNGATTSFTATGPATIDNAGLRAYAGSSLTLTQLTGYTRNVNGNTNWIADGAGSLLSLPALATITPRDGASDALLVTAENAGRIDLTALTTVSNGACRFLADGGSYLDLPLLQSYDGNTYFNPSGFHATNNSTINMPVLTSIIDGDLELDATSNFQVSQLVSYHGGTMVIDKGVTFSNLTDVTFSTLNIATVVPSFPLLSNFDNSSVTLSNGLTLSLPLVTSYTHNVNGDTTLKALGAGTVLSFPNLTTFQPRPNAGDDVFITAEDGGEVNFALLPAVLNGAATFRSTGTNSQINLPTLQSIDGYLYFTDSGFRALNGGDINVPILTSLIDCSLEIDATSTMQVAQIQSMSGAGDVSISQALSFTNLSTFSECRLFVENAVPAFPALSNIDNASIYVRNGLSLSLPLVLQFTRNINGDSYLEADGTNSVLSFPNLATFNPRSNAGDDVFVNALNGGRVELPALTVVNNGAATFKAEGTGSYLDLTLLGTFDGYLYFTNSGFFALSGGTIHSPALTAINDGNVTIDATSSMPTAQITTLSGDGTVDLTANAADFSNLTTLNRMALRVDNPAPSFPNLSNIDNASIYVTGGVTFALPLVTSYTRNENGDTYLQADGANSTLSLPNLATLNARSNAGDDILMNAYNGGEISFPNLTTVNPGAALFRADGDNSVVNITSLTSYEGYRYFTDSGFRALNNGVINLSSAVTVQMQEANVQVESGGTIVGSTLLLEDNIDVLGNGTIVANVLSHASINPNSTVSATSYGALTIDGDFTQFNDGQLTLDILNQSAGTEHDQLIITGTASLDGSVTFLDAGFPAFPDAEISVIQWANAAGSFANLTIPSLGEDLAWEALYLSSGLNLKVVVIEGPFVLGNGDGLSAEYFGDITLTNSVLTRIDPDVNFDWGTGSTDAAVPVDFFSARWTGSVMAPTAGDYLFHTESDDGTRLWVDLDQSGTFESSELLIDDWTNHAVVVNSSGTVSLAAGEVYQLKLEYYENNFDAVCKLQWTPPNSMRLPIGSTQLYSSTIDPTSAPSVSPAPDTYQQSVAVTLSSATAGATIRYTVDGTDPTETSPLYSAPLTLTQDTALRARAFSASAAPSGITHATYQVAQELPDLVITSITAPESITAGQTVSLEWTVANNGLGDYNGTRVDSFVLSTDNALDSGDVGTVFFALTDSIPAGTSQSYTRNYTAPFESPNGDLYFIGTTDSNDAVAEADQLNNTTAAGTLTNIPAVLALTSPITTISEDASSPDFSLTLSRNGDLSSPLTINLGASISGEFTFPTSVDIPAGSYSTTVPVTVLNDGITDGDQSVVLTASTAGFTGAAVTITTLDASPPSISLFFTSTILTEGTTADLAITRDPVTNSALDVTLASSDLNQFFLPTLVTIPANQASAIVTVSALQDTTLEGESTYVVSASANGHLGYTQVITINDDDVPSLTLAVSPNSVSESDGANAASATITRSPASAEALTVQLTNTLPASLAVPNTFTFAPYAESETVSLATIDNSAIDGTRSATLQAVLRAPSDNSILESSNSVPLQITDDEGPSLFLDLPQESLAEGSSMVGTVSRQPISSNSLATTLSVSDGTQASVNPVTVFIPANQASATFTFNATDEGIEDGSQTITLDATAPGHNLATATVVVTDDQLPDLTASNVSLPSSAETDETISYTYTINNEGTGANSTPTLIRAWLSTDLTLGEDILLNQYLFEGTLAAGASTTRTETFRTPNQPGLYFLLIEVDADSTVEELVETNNLAVSSNTLQTTAAYEATVATATTAAPANTVITFTGSATKLDTTPADFSQVSIHIGVQGTLRVLSVLTDANGNFSTDWTPLPGEAGAYTIEATHPSGSPSTPEDSFTLYGISSSENSLTFDLLEGLAPINQVVTLTNPADLPLSNLSATTANLPSGITATLTLGDGSPSPGLAALADLDLIVELSAASGAPVSGDFDVVVTSSEGATLTIPVSFTVSPALSDLLLNTDFLTGGAIRDSQTFVQFRVTNRGSSTTAPLNLSLPAIDWISAVTQSPLPPLAPGESTEFSIRLAPTALTSLGTYSGNMVVTGAASPLRVPFDFLVLSDMTGDLLIRAEDELTYWDAANNFPGLANAEVTLTDQFTAATVATGVTNSSGELLLEDIPEGFYVLRCEADAHSIYRQNIAIYAGRTNTRTVFLFRQTVTYTFVVNPIQIEERTKISVVTEFETNVPLPVVVVEPAYIDLEELAESGQEQVIFDITNHGLISANDMRIGFNAPPGWQITPLVPSLGDLAAKSSFQVPVIFEQIPIPLNKGEKECGGGGAYRGVVSWTLECGGNDNGYNSPVGLGGGGGSKCAVNPSGGGSGGGSINVRGGSQTLSNCGGDNCEAGALLDCLANFLPPPLGCIWGAMRCAANPTIENCVLNMIGCAAGFTPIGPIVGGALCIKGLNDCANQDKAADGKGDKAAVSAAFAPFIFQLGNLGQHNQALLDVYIEIFGDAEWFTTQPDVAFYNMGELFAQSIAPSSENGKFLSVAEMTALENLPTPSNANPAMVSAFLLRWNRSFEYWALGYQSAADVPNGLNTDFIEPILFRQKTEGAIAARDAVLEEGFESPPEAIQSKIFEAVDFLSSGGGICARVTLLIEQDAVLTRNAFDASLRLDNQGPVPLTNVSLDLTVLDVNGADATELFGISAPDIENMVGGALAPDSSGTFSYLIVPSAAAAPSTPQVYTVSGSLSYNEDGVDVVIPLAGQDISVFPTADLELKYFQQRDVFADDPFTTPIEPSVPFSLAVMAKNVGAGTATNLKIISSQPEIIENEKGLLIDFAIIGSSVQGQAVEPSLEVSFGDILPNEIKTARWLMTSSLHGHFIDYEATFEHENDFGIEDISTISSVTIHEMIHEVRDQRGGSDSLPDFLTNDLPDPNDYPDTVHLSTGAVETVTALTIANTTAPSSGNLSVPVTIPSVPSGFIYLRVPEPSDGDLTLVSVVRSDGRILPLDTNAWTTDRTFIGFGAPPNYENNLHLFDHDSTGSYTLNYALLSPPDNTAPTSQVTPLASSTFEEFTVSWTGSDNDRVAFYDIFVSEDGGPYSPWLLSTPLNTSVYLGNPDTDYAFYSIAIDASGNRETPPSSPDTMTTTDLVNSPPILDPIGDLTIDENTLVRISPTAFDPDDTGDLLWRLNAGAPANMTINRRTGAIRWPSGEQSGGTVNPVTVTVTDGNAPFASASRSFSITVNDVNSAPLLSNQNQTLNENSAYSYQVPATDADFPLQTLDYQFTSTPPAGMSMTPAGLITWTTPDLQDAAQFSVGISVTDNGTPAQTSQATLNLNVVNLSEPPVISLTQAPLIYTENDAPASLDEIGYISDGDSAHFDGGFFLVNLSGILDPGEGLQLNIGIQPGGKVVTRSQNYILVDGLIVAQLVTETPSSMRFNLSSDATPARVSTLLRATRYWNPSETPTIGARQATAILDDGDLGVSQAVSRPITVVPVLDPPLPLPDLAATVQNVSVALSRLLENDRDIEGGTLSMTTADTTSAQGGTLAKSGNRVTYTPANGFLGSDTFGYTVTSSQSGLSSTGLVTVEVSTAANFEPTVSEVAFDNNSGDLSISFHNAPDTAFDLWNGTDLQNWSFVEALSPDVNGTITWTLSPDLTTDPKSFYQIRLP